MAMILVGCGKSKKQETGKEGNYDYVLLAQPAVAAVMNQKNTLKMYKSVQALYKEKSNNKEITQASIFVKKSLDDQKVGSFLKMIENDVNTLLSDTESAVTTATSGLEDVQIASKLGVPKQMIINLTKDGKNAMGIGFKLASENKDNISAFIDTLGTTAPTDEMYYNLQNDNYEASTSLELSLITPTGAPALAFYNHIKEGNFDANSQANNVLAYFANDSKDVIIAPTNAGINAIAGNANYAIAATITFGNFYILSTGHDDNGVLDNNDRVLAFQENNVAGKIFKYIYSDLELNMTWLADANAVKDEILIKD